MRISFASLVLLGAAIAAPVHDVNRRSEQEDYDTSVSGGLTPILPRAFVAPKPIVVPKPVTAPKPPLPIPDEPAPPRLDPLDPAEPPKAPGSPDVPGKKPDGPEAPPRLTGDTPPPKAPGGKPAGNFCGLKRGVCQVGAKEELAIDKNYDRVVEPGSAPKADYISAVGIDNSKAKWFKTSIDNSPEARGQFKVLEDFYDKTYNPKKNPNSKFDDDAYYWLVESERGSFGPSGGGAKKGFIETSNNHGEKPTMVIEDMFSGRDLYTGCKDCKFEMFDLNFERPPIPRPADVPPVKISQGIADNWRVSAAKAGKSPDEIEYIGMNNVATPESRAIFDKFGIETGKDKTYTSKDPEFAKIEETVQSKVINNELKFEQDTFGKKTVAEHRIFKDKDGFTYHMVSKLAPAA